MKIHQSAEDYLEKILMIQERKGEVHSIDIANELGFSKPSVSVAMKNLRLAGYISMDESAASHWKSRGARLPPASTSGTNC